jgi:hypothetical protein
MAATMTSLPDISGRTDTKACTLRSRSSDICLVIEPHAPDAMKTVLLA